MKKLTSGLIELATFIMLAIAAMWWIFAFFLLMRTEMIRLLWQDSWCFVWWDEFSGFVVDIWFLLSPVRQHSSADIDEPPARHWSLAWNQTPGRFNYAPLVSVRLPVWRASVTYVGRVDFKHLAGCSSSWCVRTKLLCQQSGAVSPRDQRF